MPKKLQPKRPHEFESAASQLRPVAASAVITPSQHATSAAKRQGAVFFRSIWQRIKDFSGCGGDATYLMSRWLLLRAVGLVYIIIFLGVIQDQMALAGPQGIVPLADYLKHVADSHTGPVAAFFAAPSLFWISSGETMIRILSFLGLGAALAVVLNLWPRAALFTCWLTFTSFVTTWHVFSGAQLDNLMLEVALLIIPFCPGGFRPGLGEKSPPSALVIFMTRWLLFRVMFESGLIKLIAGDSHWRDFTAMELMYETSPFPTALGFLDHQLPHAYHVLEILFTFFAELIAPILAVVGGRRGRWIAWGAWTIFQAGIQLTNNFGWLNTAAIGLGLLLLDDQMITAATAKFRLSFLSRWLSPRPAELTNPPRSAPRWSRGLLGVGLGVHFIFSLLMMARICRLPLSESSPLLRESVNAVSVFGSVNAYTLYAQFDPVRYQVEFLGSNDGGQTWRPYEYRYMPQNEKEISPFIAPWFARFDASLQIAVYKGNKDRTIHVVATHLLAANSLVTGQFRRNPFPDKPPTLIRMQGYRLRFTDAATFKKTGRYWTKELAGEYLPPLRLDQRGQILPFDLATGDRELQRGNHTQAMALFAQLYQEGSTAAGFRLVNVLMRSAGSDLDRARAFNVLNQLAQSGEVIAEHNIGVGYEYGIGVTTDLAQAESWYRTAANHGYTPAYFSLGALLANKKSTASSDIEALAVLLKVATLLSGEDAITDYIHQQQPALVRKLKDRMSPAAILAAQKRSAL